MTEEKLDRVSEILKAIAHPARMRILLLLTEQPSVNVSALQEQIQIKQSMLSHCLIKLKSLGILTSTKQGAEVYYSIADESLLEVISMLLDSVDTIEKQKWYTGNE